MEAYATIIFILAGLSAGISLNKGSIEGVVTLGLLMPILGRCMGLF